MTQINLLQRLRCNDCELIRLDITASLFSDWTDSDKAAFIRELPVVLPHNRTVTSVQLSGLGLQRVLSVEQIQSLVLVIGDMPAQVEDLCIFRGGCHVLDEVLVSECLGRLRSLKTLLLFQFHTLYEHPVLASALRQHESLERITITLPPTTGRSNNKQHPWGCLDVFAMAFCQMPKLLVLQLRCSYGECVGEIRKQREPVISPEAFALLLSSATISSLALENVGLYDDHIDVFVEELSRNKTLASLDLKENCLTEDALYTTARVLPLINRTALTSLDLSGVAITEDAGQVLADGMANNTKLTNLELEGCADRFKDEFHIPVGHSEAAWMKQIYYYIRLNRARHGVGDGTLRLHKSHFVEALTSVTDQLDCLYYFIRTYSGHFKGCP